MALTNIIIKNTGANTLITILYILFLLNAEEYDISSAIFFNVIILTTMLMYGKEASNRKQEIDRQHYTIPNQRPKDKHCGKI